MSLHMMWCDYSVTYTDVYHIIILDAVFLARTLYWQEDIVDWPAKMRIKREVEKKIRRLGCLNFRKAPCCSCLHAPLEHLRGRVARHASEGDPERCWFCWCALVCWSWISWILLISSIFVAQGIQSVKVVTHLLALQSLLDHLAAI